MRIVIYQCSQSPKASPNAWLIKSKSVIQTRTFNLGAKACKCKYCGKAFLRKDTLQRHLRAFHKGFVLDRSKLNFCIKEKFIL